MADMSKFVCENSYTSFIEVVALILLGLVLILSWFCYHLWKKVHSNLKKNRSSVQGETMLLNCFCTVYFLLMAYADSMVDTYIYGYLRKVIPDHGYTDEGGIKERINFYKAEHNLSDEEFPLNKMFIIVTASGYIPPLLDKLDEPGRIENRQNLAPLILNRAGVDGRVYKSAVYKIYFRGDITKHITVAMEGAPPLLCLSDSCKENPALRKYKKDIIYLFYKKLESKIQEHEEFENCCEVIYLDDNKKSLADYLILRHIEGK